MPYKLASRDNLNSDILDSWPAVLDESFTKFGNKIESQCFYSEDQIFNWLEAKCTTKNKHRLTNMQKFRNGSPNKLYSVYFCPHDNPHHGAEFNDVHLYDLRSKKLHEAHSTYQTSNGDKLASSFKRMNKKIVSKEKVEYSSSVRLIADQYYEGIYPLDVNQDAQDETQFMDFVTKIHNSDIDENLEKDYSIVVADNSYVSKWLEIFIKKLRLVEKYLQFFAAGGRGDVVIESSELHDSKIQYIMRLLSEHREGTVEDAIDHNKIINLVIDPHLYDGQVFQIRYKDTLLTWHKNYSTILEKYQMIPSEEFSELILNFSLADFFKQRQKDESLDQIIKNMEEYYGVNRSIMNTRFVGRSGRIRQPRYHKITKSFI